MVLFRWGFVGMFILFGGCTKKLVKSPVREVGQSPQRLDIQNARHHALRRTSPSHSVQNRSSHALFFYLKGRLHAIEKRPRKAIRMFKLALVYDPKSSFLRYKIANQYRIAKSLYKAIYWANQSIKMNSRFAPVHTLLGQLYWSMNKRKQAIRSYQTALKIAPRFLKAYLRLDEVFSALHRPISVQETLMLQMIKELPKESEGFFRLGQLKEQQGDFDNAAQFYQKAVYREPSHAMAIFYLSRLYERQYLFEKAIRGYRVLLSYLPEEWPIRVRLGALLLKKKKDIRIAKYQFDYILREATEYPLVFRIYLIGRELVKQGCEKEAIPWLERSLQVYHREKWQKKPGKSIAFSFSNALFWLGSAYRFSGKEKEALRIFQKIQPKKLGIYFEAQIQMIELEVRGKSINRAKHLLSSVRKRYPLKTEMWIRLSQALVDGSSSLEAAQELALTRTKLDQTPNDTNLLYHKAYLLFRLQRKEKSLQILKKLIKKDQHHAPSLNFLGYIYSDKGSMLSNARRLILRALQIEPENAYYLDSLGWVYVRMGKLKMARAILRSVRYRLPRESIVWFHLAQTWERDGQMQRALEHYRKAKALSPEPELLSKIEIGIKRVLHSQSSRSAR